MKRWVVLVTGGAMLLAGYYAPSTSGQGAGARPPAGVEHKGRAYQFNRITDEVYHAIGTGTMSVGSNSVVIINQNDVMLVDSHITPAAAWALLDELKSLTPKPVRYVVNGNQMYGPELEVIGHEFTREMLSNPQAIFEGRTYLKKLDFGTVLPGHGRAFTDRQKIDQFQAYLRDFWNKAGEFKRRSIPAEQAAQQIDMTSHRGNFAAIQAPGVDVRAMQRAYERLDEITRR